MKGKAGMHIDGGCHCGLVSYEAEVNPEDVAICHCSDCQSLTGTAYRVTVSTPTNCFAITAGEPKLYVKLGDNGKRRLQYFCPNCGSPIFTTGEGPNAQEVGIRLGTVNQRHELRPRSQIWCSSRLDWADNIADLPKCSGDQS